MFAKFGPMMNQPFRNFEIRSASAKTKLFAVDPVT